MLKSSLRGLTLASLASGALFVSVGQAQTPGEALSDAFPELADRVNAGDVTTAVLFDRLAEIRTSGDAEAGRDQLRETLMMQANMSMAEMMQQMNMEAAMDMRMGPFGEIENETFNGLRSSLQDGASASDAREAFDGGALPARAAAVIQRARDFHTRILDIYSDDGASNKTAAVDEAVRDYLSDAELSVPDEPKLSALMFAHPYAGSFKTGFPELSGLIWASNWLKLAALEPLLLGGDDSTVESGVETTIGRYESKLEGMPGMAALPSEMPRAPAMAPMLFSRHERAAIILDNAAMLQTVIADLLVHPDLDDLPAAIDQAVSVFTSRGTDLDDRRDYLLAALRAGIFDQGGPALGELARSERNRSRMEMEMGGHLVLPGMN